MTAAAIPAPGAERTAYPSAMAAWYTVIIMMLLYVCSYMDRKVLTMLVTLIQEDLSVSDFQMSLLLGPAFGIFYTILGIPAGWISDRYSRRGLIAIGAGLWGLATAASGLANTYWQLAFARLSIGVGEATLTPAAHSLIAEQFPPKRLSLALSVYMLGVTFGGGLALALSGVLIDFADEIIAAAGPMLQGFKPWQVVFFLVGAPTLVLAPLVFTVRDTRTKPKPETVIPRGEGKAFIRSRAKLLTPFFLAFGFTSIAVNALVGWIPAYMARNFTDLSMAEIGAGYGLTMFLATGTGQILWSIVVDRLYGRGVRDIHTRFHMYCWLLGAPAVVLAVMAGGPMLFLLLMGVFFLFTFAFQGYANAGLQLVTPPQFRGRMSAAFLAFTNLVGMLFGPTSVGLLTDNLFQDPKMVGWAMAIVVVVCAPLGMAMLWLASRQRRQLEAEMAAEAQAA